MILHPVGKFIFVSPVVAAAVSEGGIFLPSAAKEAPQTGIVRGLGPKVPEDCGVKVGDVVVFAKYTGNEIRADGKPILAMTEKDLLCVLEDTPDSRRKK
jgi:chaperonin GroES